MHTKIIWIERGHRSDNLRADLRKRKYRVATVQSGKDALAMMPQFHPDLAVVNTATLRSSGARICRQLRQAGLPVILIANRKTKPAEEYANEILVPPFTIRKLINRIKKFIRTGEKRLRRGPLMLDCDYHYLHCNGSHTELTPLTCRLLKLLMEHPNEALERDFLYSTVWETDYTGDTRSLDVHISWIRQAMGERGKDLLKTIRGVGYRLDVKI